MNDVTRTPNGLARGLGGLLSIMTGLLSGGAELWLGHQTPPDSGEWSSPLLWVPLPALPWASVAALSWGFRLLPVPAAAKIILSALTVVAILGILKEWSSYAVGLILVAGFMGAIFSLFKRSWWAAIAASSLLAVWWIGAASYAVWSHERYIAEFFGAVALLAATNCATTVASAIRYSQANG